MHSLLPQDYTYTYMLISFYQVLKQRIQAGIHATAWDAISYSIKHEFPFGLFDKGKLSSQILRDIPYAIVTLVSYEILQNAIKRTVEKNQQNMKDKEEMEIYLEINTNDNISNDNKVQNLTSDNNDNNDSKNKNKNKNINSYLNFMEPNSKTTGNKLISKKLRDALCGSLAGGLGSFVTTPMDVVKTRMMATAQYSTIAEAIFKIYNQEGFLTFFVGEECNRQNFSLCFFFTFYCI